MHHAQCMRWMSSARHVFLLSCFLLLASVNGWAANLAFDLFESAKVHFEMREDISRVDLALIELETAEQMTSDADLKYDILILSSRTYYWRGLHESDKNIRKETFSAGMQKAEAAKKLNDDFAEAYYYAGINLARWAETNGMVASLGKKGEFIANMEGAINRRTRQGEDGESIDGYGPRRTLGRMYKKLPGIFGGSREKSLNELEYAVENTNRAGKKVVLNVVFLADTLLDRGSQAERNRAHQLLREISLEDPADLMNPSYIPENKEDLKFVRDLLAGKNIP
ncbi:MAG: hypothetical protein ACO3A2_11135 [Bdellovibrionia bacterium]